MSYQITGFLIIAYGFLMIILCQLFATRYIKVYDWAQNATWFHQKRIRDFFDVGPGMMVVVLFGFIVSVFDGQVTVSFVHCLLYVFILTFIHPASLIMFYLVSMYYMKRRCWNCFFDDTGTLRAYIAKIEQFKALCNTNPKFKADIEENKYGTSR